MGWDLKCSPWRNTKLKSFNTANVSEIRPVEVGSWNPMIYKVLAPSQVVVWDFFHQQYYTYLYIRSLELTASLFLKKQWLGDDLSLFGSFGLFSGAMSYVSFREGNRAFFQILDVNTPNHQGVTTHNSEGLKKKSELFRGSVVPRKTELIFPSTVVVLKSTWLTVPIGSYWFMYIDPLLTCHLASASYLFWPEFRYLVP